MSPIVRPWEGYDPNLSSVTVEYAVDRSPGVLQPGDDVEPVLHVRSPALDGVHADVAPPQLPGRPRPAGSDDALAVDGDAVVHAGQSQLQSDKEPADEVVESAAAEATAAADDEAIDGAEQEQGDDRLNAQATSPQQPDERRRHRTHDRPKETPNITTPPTTTTATLYADNYSP